MNILKRLIVFTFFSSTIVFTGCVMMLLPAMPKMHSTFDQTDEEKLILAMDALVSESIEALKSNLTSYYRILLEKVEIAGDILPPEKFRASIKESLHKNGLVVINQLEDGNVESDKGKITSNNEERVAILIAHLYKIDNELWMTLQLLDTNSRNIFWTSIRSRSLTNPDNLESLH